MRLATLFALCAVFATNNLAVADHVFVTNLGPSSAGTITDVVIQEGPNGYDVSFTGVGNLTIPVAIEADIPVVIHSVHVESNDPDGLGRSVQLTFRPKPLTNGRIVRVENVIPTSADFIQDGELVVNVITDGNSNGTDGNVGVAGTTPGGLIAGHVINTITANASGNLTATVYAIGRIGSGDSNINTIAVPNGSMYGDVWAPYGQITRGYP